MPEFESVEKRAREFDHNGRYMAVHPEKPGTGAIPWTRATTLARTVDDEYNLNAWKMERVALGMGHREDLFGVAAGLTDSDADRALLRQVTADAYAASGADAGRNRGTALHAFTHELNRTGMSTAPSIWQPHLKVYQRGMLASGWAIDSQRLEQRVINLKCNSMGQFDNMCSWVQDRGTPRDQREYTISDTKTEKEDKDGNVFEYTDKSIAIQLAIYANADYLWFADPNDPTNPLAPGVRVEPMPRMNLKFALVMWLPSIGEPKFEIYKVDIERGWNAVQLALDVRAWRKEKRLVTPIGKWEYQPPKLAAPSLAIDVPALSTLPVVPPIVASRIEQIKAEIAQRETAATPLEVVTAEIVKRQDAAAFDAIKAGVERCKRNEERAANVREPAEATALWRELTASGEWSDSLQRIAADALKRAAAQSSAVTVQESAPAEARRLAEAAANAADAARDAITEPEPVEPEPATWYAVTEPEPASAPAEPAVDEWTARARAVRTGADATALWRAATAAGVWSKDLEIEARKHLTSP